jgi:hypothetical protein
MLRMVASSWVSAAAAEATAARAGLEIPVVGFFLAPAAFLRACRHFFKAL